MHPLRASIATALTTIGLGVSGQFHAEFQYFVQGPTTMALQDMDADGRPDLLLTTRQGMVVHPNTGVDGLFDPQLILANGEIQSWAADVDNDGLPEIFGSVPDLPGIRMYRNQGAFHFQAVDLLSNTLNPTDMVAADLDLDGDIDLTFTTSSGAVVVFYNSNSIGGFSPAYTVAQLNGAKAPQVADVDHDGWPDLVFSSPTAGQVRTCLNQSGTFDSSLLLSDQGRAVARDLDNDGKSDLLVASGGTVSWRRNMSPTSLLADASNLATGFTGASVIAVSDLDNDGDLDAVVASTVTGDIAWYPNLDGQGLFGERQVIAYDIPGVNNIVASDADGDGDQDLFVASTTLDKVFWFSNMLVSEGTLLGRVFNDINGDGVFNGNDHGLVNIRVEASDMGATYTNASGMYWYEAVAGPYLVWLPPVDGWTLTTAGSHMVEVPGTGTSSNNDFGLTATAPSTSLQVNVTSQPTRCNEEVQYWLRVYNNGTTVCDVQLALDLNPTSAYVSSSIEHDGSGIDPVRWTLQGLQPNQERNILVTVLMPGSGQMGATLTDHLVATALVAGQEAGSFGVDHSFMLACAMDPNDKLVEPAGSGPDHITPMGSRLHYTVRFQNTGNATAHDVYILDTLDAGLDPTTFRLQGMSHVGHTLLQPDGVLRFTFNNIMLPDSGSDMLGSQGYIRYTIAHAAGLEEGTRIENTAGIYFDMNEPVITNTTFNTMGFGPTGSDEAHGTGDGLTVRPNPASSTATVQLPSAVNGRVQVELMDATGRLVRSLTRRSDTIVLDVEDLPQGLYIIRTFEDVDGRIRTARLVVE